MFKSKLISIFCFQIQEKFYGFIGKVSYNEHNFYLIWKTDSSENLRINSSQVFLGKIKKLETSFFILDILELCNLN
jgi:hypothetical protein